MMSSSMEEIVGERACLWVGLLLTWSFSKVPSWAGTSAPKICLRQGERNACDARPLGVACDDQAGDRI